MAKLRPAFGAIDRLFADFITREHVPGAAWGIVIDGELAHVGVSGYRELASRVPVDADSVFRIASMTKSFTAMAILKLRDEGKLALDDPAERYVPELQELRYPTTDSPRITIRHLLSHAEGFPEDNPWGDQQLAATDEEMSKMLRAGIPFSNAPGHRVRILQLRLCHSRTNRLRCREDALSRLHRGHHSAAARHGFDNARAPVRAGEPAGARLSLGGRAVEGRAAAAATAHSVPMGGMLTSIRDLGRYVAAFVSAWPPRDDPETAPIKRSSLREMQQISRPRPTTVTRGANSATQLNAGGYGFGLGISESCTFGHIVAHSGGLPGFGSQMRWLPEYGVGLSPWAVAPTPDGAACSRALWSCWQQTGGLLRRMPAPSPALIEARDAVSRLVHAVGRCAGRSHRRGEPVLGPLEGSPPPRNRSAARQSRSLSSRRYIQRRRERAPRIVAAGVRARRDRGVDHSGADDAADVCNFLRLVPPLPPPRPPAPRDWRSPDH